MSAVFAPSVNSYKRLVPGYEAPVYIGWSRREPLGPHERSQQPPRQGPGRPRLSSAARIPRATRTSAFAALLHAGLEGIERGYELPEPIERNLYDLTEEDRQAMGVQRLPESLGEAIDEMSRSELVEQALGSHIFSRYIDLKREEVVRIPRAGDAVGDRAILAEELGGLVAVPSPATPRGAHLEMVGGVLAATGWSR